MSARRLTIISRKSPLALWQATHVKQQLEELYPDLQCQIMTRMTTGDQTSLPLQAIGGKNLFIKELQQALLDREADIAVHSLKDMSVYPTKGLQIAAVLKREDPRDVLVSAENKALSDLPPGALVGTSSLRRRCQLWHLRPDLEIQPLRGNVGTRLEQLKSGHFDAIVLAAAGLKRLQLTEAITQYFDPDGFIPAIAQGVIGVECRSEDTVAQELLTELNDPLTEISVLAEQAVNRELHGDCFTPLGAYAFIEEKRLRLIGMLGSADGREIFRTQAEGDQDQAEALGRQIGRALLYWARKKK